MNSIRQITAAVKGSIDDGGEAEEVALSLAEARRRCAAIARYAPRPDLGPAPADEDPGLDVLGTDLDSEAERARELAELANAWHVPAGTPMECGYDDYDMGLGEPWEDTDEDSLGRELFEHSTIRHHLRRRADQGSRDEMERWGGGTS